MSEQLIELVRQRAVLYDTKCKEYRNHSIRSAAWDEIAEILNEPAEKCKEDWTKMRNAFASALKRRRRKSGQVPYVPWKYEETMSFLLPSMETRNTKTHNVILQPESPTVEINYEFNQSPPGSPCSNRSNESYQSQACSSNKRPNNPQLVELYDLIKSSNEIKHQRQPNVRQDLDETDLFFLSMSKAVKSLPKIEQIKIKLDLHTAISQAEIRQLENRPNIKTD